MKIAREPYALYYFLKYGFKSNSRLIENVFTLQFGRVCLSLIARDLLRKNIKSIWIPGLICDVVPAALRQAGIEVRYYPLLPTYNPDFSWLKARCREEAFLYVNYFGIKQTTKDCLRWARSKGLVTIEDNAHGILGGLGERADYSISSIGKALGLRFGSIFSVPPDSRSHIASWIQGYSLKMEISTTCSAFPTWMFDWLRNKKQKEIEDLSLKELPSFQPSHSFFSSLLWQFAPRVQISHAKRDSFLRLWEQLSKNPKLKSLQPWSECPLGIQDVPWFFPLRIESSEIGFWMSHFQKAGIEVFIWPQFPNEMKEGHEAWRNCYSTILALPIWKLWHHSFPENVFNSLLLSTSDKGSGTRERRIQVEF